MTDAKDTDKDLIPEELQPTREETRAAKRQRYIEAQGKEVPLDYFLYSCLEQERLLKAAYPAGNYPVRWPLLPTKLGAPIEGEEPEPVSAEISDMGLPGLLQRLVAWYRDEHSDLASSVPLDHEQMVTVAPIIVAFNRDVADLYVLKTGEKIPDYERSVGNNKFWDDLARAVSETFSTYAHLLMRYIKWTHADEPTEEFVPGSRPPVGRYAPPPPPRSAGRGRDGERSGGYGGGGHSGGRSSGGGRDRDRGGRPERGGERNFRGNRPDRGPRPSGEGDGRRNRNDHGQTGEHRERQPRGDYREGRNAERGKRRGNDEASAKLEAAAMDEVGTAIATLKANPSVDEVTLRPANSFYRRLQHQKIVDAGYHSFSVGEGPDRAVKVSRREDNA